MSGVFNYAPGQTVTFFQEVRDGYDQYTDDGYIPVVTRIICPNMSVVPGLPQNMTYFDVGLWYFQFKLPRYDRHRGEEHHHREIHYYRKERYNGEEHYHHAEERWRPDGYCAPPTVIGTYFVDIIYKDPDTQLLVNDSVQIIVTAPFGQFGALSRGHRHEH